MNNWEQKYKDLIARLQKAKENDDVCDERYCCVIDEIAPELKESEDEQHRRWILEYLYDGLRKSDEQFKDQFKAAIAWLEKQGEKDRFIKEEIECIKGYRENAIKKLEELEKQGEQKVSYTTLVETGNGGINALVTKELPTNGCDDEQKPSDMVEPKFHEGDILKHNKANIICKVLSANVGFYSLMNILGGDEMELFNVEKNFHLWTIQDAKDGDVLATSAGAFIYNGNNGGGSCPGCYCGIDTLGNFKTGVEHHWTGKPAFPATKSQRDTLFTKMKESGYEWDSEKKELKLLITNGGDFDKKNCEWNPAWSEDDEEKFRDVIRLIEQGAPVQSMRDHYTNWFKSLKDRVQPIHEYSDTEKQEIFLRSQRPHFWRPTKGQLECLDVAIDKVDKDHSPFFTNRAYLTLKALKKQLEQL